MKDADDDDIVVYYVMEDDVAAVAARAEAGADVAARAASVWNARQKVEDIIKRYDVGDGSIGAVAFGTVECDAVKIGIRGLRQP